MSVVAPHVVPRASFYGTAGFLGHGLRDNPMSKEVGDAILALPGRIKFVLFYFFFV